MRRLPAAGLFACCWDGGGGCWRGAALTAELPPAGAGRAGARPGLAALIGWLLQLCARLRGAGRGPRGRRALLPAELEAPPPHLPPALPQQPTDVVGHVTRLMTSTGCWDTWRRAAALLRRRPADPRWPAAWLRCLLLRLLPYCAAAGGCGMPGWPAPAPLSFWGLAANKLFSARLHPPFGKAAAVNLPGGRRALRRQPCPHCSCRGTCSAAARPSSARGAHLMARVTGRNSAAALIALG